MTKYQLLIATAFSAAWIGVGAAQGPNVSTLPSLPPPAQGLTLLEGAADHKKPEPLPQPGKVEPAKEAPKDAAPPAVHVEMADCSAGGKASKCGKFKCHIDWLRPWKCEDLEMKPFEPVPSYCGCKKFFHCPKPEKEKKNGNGEKKEEQKKDEKKEGGEAKKDEAKKDEEKKDGKEKNGNGEEEKKDEGPKTALMQAINCCCPKHDDRMRKRGDSVYGWIQQGFAANPDSPSDRINYGVNFNWRSNDYRLNQVYFVYENPLEHEDKPNVGYRADFFSGTDAPFIAANGLFSDFTGFDPTSGFGVEGPGSFRQMNRVGIDLPQSYLEAHLPHCITEKGIDVRLGKFYTLMGREVYPGKDTDFYSRTFENVLGTAFTHTGILTTIHVTDTLDLILGVVRGWDVFEDNNDRPTCHHALIWNSCDKRYNWTTTFTTGPEQFQNNDNYRTAVTSYLTALFGRCNQWRIATGGLYGYEANVVTDPVTGGLNDAAWYDYSVHLFYTVEPRLILGMRAEWFRDDDGARTAVFKRPGFAANFYDLTFGITYKPYQNLRIRPEVRFDWANGPAIDGSASRPYDALRDLFQTTCAIDIIWEF